MAYVLAATLVVVFLYSAYMVLRIRRLKRIIHSFDRVVDVEAHLASCEASASSAIERQHLATANADELDKHSAALQSSIAELLPLLGGMKTAVELSQQIERDTAKAKQLSAALGRFENALQLKEFLRNQELSVQRANEELVILEQKIGASQSLLELQARIEQETQKMRKIAATLGDLRKASELAEFIQKQQAEIATNHNTLESWRAIVGSARTVVELHHRIAQDQARVKQLAQVIGGLQQVPQLNAYLAQQQQAIQQNNAQLAQFSQAIANARTASEIHAQVTYYQNMLAVLKADVEAVEEAKGLQEFGFYRPRYNFESSQEYELRLDNVRDKQKDMLSAKKACVCATEWTIDGDKREGKKMTDKQVKLMLRAFNGESDAAVSKVRYNNAVSLENRIKKAFEAINKLGETQRTYIAPEFCNLKLEELHLAHEFQRKKEEEREAQRALRDQMREEEKVAKEIERACEEAERDEQLKTMALDRARRELDQKAGQQTAKLESLVSRLENELQEALDRKAKAIARAQLTKSGHVYILSNVGTFGEGVYKIGMSRRLEPLERVAELGGASVPFPFDVHAMIYCEDAPRLEAMLHRHFADRRVNMVNLRREFFMVTLDEIRAAVAEYHGHVTFVTIPEAAQFRETVALRREQAQATSQLQIA